MKYITLLVISFAFLLGCKVNSVNKQVEQSGTIAPCGIELYYSLGGLGSAVKQEFEEQGFKRITLINQRRIVNPNDEWLLDRSILTSNVEKFVPDPNSEEYIVLNWEGKPYLAIQAGPSHPDYKRATLQFIEAYDLVKRLRPRTKVGYYGFPIRDYWNRNEKWRAKNTALIPFLKNFDVLYPSIYDFYDSSTGRGKGDDAYVRDNIEEAIRMGERMNKPVLPFVWHRYHTSNKKKRLELIPEDEFIAHVSAATSTKVEGRGIAGLVWWSSEYSRFVQANRKRFEDKKIMRAAWEKEATVILPRYFAALRTATERSCQD